MNRNSSHFILLTFPAFFIFFIAQDNFMAVDYTRSILFSLPLALVLFLVISILMNGRAQPFNFIGGGRWIDTIFNLAAVCGMSWGLTLMANGYLDHSQAKIEAAPVVRKYAIQRRHSFSKTHYVAFKAKEHLSSIVVSSEEYDNLVPSKSSVEYQVRPGFFGIEWMSNYRIISRQPASTPK